jgi:hypothetical protein
VNPSAPAVNEARAEFDGITAVQVDAVTKHARDHAAQLEQELAQVPEPNFYIASQIWKRLDAMDASDLNLFLSRTSDPQVVAAVMNAPSAFPYGSNEARAQMTANYAREHKPAQHALLSDNRHFIDAVQNFRDMLVRKFRDVAK